MIEKNVVFRIPLYIPNKCSGYLFELLIKISDKSNIFSLWAEGLGFAVQDVRIKLFILMAQITIPFAYWMSN